MTYEMAGRLFDGKFPAEWYHVANTEDELVALIEFLKFGNTICDSKPGSGLAFCLDRNGKVALATDEFLGGDDDADENPDFHVGRYDSAKEAVADFKINGLPVFDVVKGCRFTRQDMRLVF